MGRTGDYGTPSTGGWLLSEIPDKRCFMTNGRLVFEHWHLLGTPLTIQLFVYPDAYPIQGTWAAVLLYLMASGPGKLSIDHLIASRYC